jgi:hypothetical protein
LQGGRLAGVVRPDEDDSLTELDFDILQALEVLDPQASEHLL